MKIRNEKDLSCLKPLKKYDIPKYPVYTDTHDNPELLKKLPSRWQKNAKVLGCLGVLGVFTLSGCPPFFPGFGGNFTCSKCGFAHNGGSGGAPIYIVYLTEQEALSLIRTKAEAAGLNLNSEPPDYTVTVWNWREIGLDLYDSQKDVAFSFVSTSESGYQWCNIGQNKEMAEEAKKEFAKLGKNTSIGVLYDPGKPLGYMEPDEKKMEETGNEIKEHLAFQVNEFIKWLQAQGI